MKVIFSNRMIQFYPNTRKNVLEFGKINTYLSRKTQNQAVSVPSSRTFLRDPLTHTEDAAKYVSFHEEEYIWKNMNFGISFVNIKYIAPAYILLRQISEWNFSEKQFGFFQKRGALCWITFCWRKCSNTELAFLLAYTHEYLFRCRSMVGCCSHKAKI